MIYVGIDVSKDKRDCCIVNSDGEILADAVTVENNIPIKNAANCKN